MTARRQKTKQKPQLNKQLEPQPQQPDKNVGHWKENLGRYLLDISKYVLTGVVITSLFKDMHDNVLLYVLGMVIVLIALIIGLILTNKKALED